MSSPHSRMAVLHGDQGFTLIELLVSMLVMVVVTMAALFFLQFTTEDVSHITARVNVDQEGRTALEKIMLELHSACVAPSVIPIQAESNENEIKFISESGSQPTFKEVHLHEIIYKAATGTSEGTLVEQSYKSTGGTAPKYTWSTTPTETKLLKGVRQTEYESKKTPIFQYYRYYQTGDTIPTGDTTLPYGELYSEAMKGTGTEKKLTEEEAAKVVKATVSFTLAPEGKESVSFNHDRPVALEDSAIFRLAPSSEEHSNLPCAPET